jgi:hypothetical protein
MSSAEVVAERARKWRAQAARLHPHPLFTVPYVPRRSDTLTPPLQTPRNSDSHVEET